MKEWKTMSEDEKFELATKLTLAYLNANPGMATGVFSQNTINDIQTFVKNFFWTQNAALDFLNNILFE